MPAARRSPIPSSTWSSARYSRFSRMRTNTRMGPTTTTSHAPSVNLVTAKISTTNPVSHAGREVDHQPPAPAPLLVRQVVLGHTEAGHREPGEHADRVERHQVVDVRPDREDERQRYDGQHDDAVGEHQPVPALHQPAGQERVLGHEAGQERETVEAGVAPGEQDQRGRELDEVEQDAAGPAAEDEVRLLGQHGRRPVRVRRRVLHVRQPGDAADQEGEDHALGDQHLPGVASLRAASAR